MLQQNELLDVFMWYQLTQADVNLTINGKKIIISKNDIGKYLTIFYSIDAFSHEHTSEEHIAYRLAVASFQKKHNLTVNGLFHGDTLKNIQQNFKEKILFKQLPKLIEYNKITKNSFKDLYSNLNTFLSNNIFMLQHEELLNVSTWDKLKHSSSTPLTINGNNFSIDKNLIDKYMKIFNEIDAFSPQLTAYQKIANQLALIAFHRENNLKFEDEHSNNKIQKIFKKNITFNQQPLSKIKNKNKESAFQNTYRTLNKLFSNHIFMLQHEEILTDNMWGNLETNSNVKISINGTKITIQKHLIKKYKNLFQSIDVSVTDKLTAYQKISYKLAIAAFEKEHNLEMSHSLFPNQTSKKIKRKFINNVVFKSTQKHSPTRVKINTQNSKLTPLKETIQRNILDELTKDKSTVGGIDFHSGHLELQTSGEPMRFSIPANIQELKNLNIEGFVPTILHVNPIVNLPLLLGLEKTPKNPYSKTPKNNLTLKHPVKKYFHKKG